MPQYLAPGVYIEELAGPKPIEAVGTATGAFVGIAERGPVGEAKLITNWTQFVDTFGGFIPSGYLAYAVNQFFSEGGTSCYVVRTCHYDYTTTPAVHAAGTGTLTLDDATPADTLKIDALSPGSWSDHLWIESARAKKDPANKFRLAVWYKGREEEPFEELTKSDVLGKVNGSSKYIRIAHAGTSTLAPAPSAVTVSDRGAPAQPTMAITALDRAVSTSIVNQGATRFGILVFQAGALVERFLNLTPAEMERKVSGVSAYIKVQDLNSTNAAPGNLPQAVSTVLNDRAAIPLPTLSLTALRTGVSIDVADGAAANTFRVTAHRGADPPEIFDNLTMANVEATINGTSPNIFVTDLVSATAAPDNRPAVAGSLPLAVATVFNDRAVPAVPTLAATALRSGVSIEMADGAAANSFRVTARRGADPPEVFDNLTMANVEATINGNSPNLLVRNLGSATAAPANRPAGTPPAVNLTNPPGVLTFFALTGGDDGLGDGLTLNDATPAPSLLVNAFRESVKVAVENATSGAARFKLTVTVSDVLAETFDELLMDTVEATINGASQYIEVVSRGSNRPANRAAADVPSGLADMDFIGDAATQNGLHAFDIVDAINIVAIPDRPGDREVIIAAYTYCGNRKDCFFVADSPFGLDPQGVLAFKEGTGVFAGNAFNSSYAALYYPWIAVIDPVTGNNKFVPPSGATAGTYSSTDVLRGVHKAPAGTIDGYLNSAVGIERIVTKGEQDLLNPEHVNVIRSFPGAGIVIWGARTLSADPEWRYVNVRRLLLFIEESIDENTQWVVFEPNDRSLWARVKRDVTAFLTIVWRSGALFGSTSDEAFFVKIDDENNPPEVRDAGRLIIDIGVAPVKPAEFVIFRITQITPVS